MPAGASPPINKGRDESPCPCLVSILAKSRKFHVGLLVVVNIMIIRVVNVAVRACAAVLRRNRALSLSRLI